MTDADRLKIAMSLLNEISHYGLTSVVQGALRVQAAQVFAEYKATRPLKPLESQPTESVSALINATVQMNAAMDVARGLDCDATNGVDDRGKWQSPMDAALGRNR